MIPNDFDIEQADARASADAAAALTGGADSLTTQERNMAADAGARSAWYGGSLHAGVVQTLEDVGKTITDDEFADVLFDASQILRRWEAEERHARGSR